MNILSEDESTRFALLIGWQIKLVEKNEKNQYLPKVHEEKGDLKVLDFDSKDDAIKKLEKLVVQLKCLN